MCLSRRLFGNAWTRPYLFTTLIVAVVGLLAKALDSLFSLADLSIVFLVAVLIGAVRWGLGASIYAAVASVLVYDFFFVVPLYTFTIASAQDVLALIIFLVVAVLTSNLTVRIRDQAEAARQREQRTATLYALSQQLARAPDLESILEDIAGQVARILGVQAAILLPQGDELVLSAPGRPPDVSGAHDRAAALWAWQKAQMTGNGTDTQRKAECTYAPLTTARGTVGVLRLRLTNRGQGLGPDERRLLEALAGQAAVAIERANLAHDMARARVLAETERLRTALLSSVSHDLRTPLASVIGAATSLLEYGNSYDPASQRELQQTILEEAERLDRFVANLLDMTRLESGALHLRRDWVEVKDIIGSALSRQERRLGDHQVKVSVAPDLPLVAVDFVLMEQVLVNLLENAAKYSAPATTIEISAGQIDDAVAIEVTDEGIGVAAEDLERIFDKFYRVFRGDSHNGGSGLGLSICRGIVEAHGGWIVAQPRRDGSGTTLVLTLPVGDGTEPEGR
jgi:two-component system, OmpR family, sensor histidine kinase KdpD